MAKRKELPPPQVVVGPGDAEQVLVPVAFLDTDQVGRVFNRSRRIITEWVAWGWLKPVARGSRSLFAWSDVQELVERFTAEGYPSGPAPRRR